MLRQIGGHIDLAPARCIDPDPPCVEMKLAADPAGQERLGTTIFGVAYDRVANGSHVRPQLVRPAGKRLQLDPGRAIPGMVDDPPACLRGQPMFFADVHLFPAGPRLLGKRSVDRPLVRVWRSDHDCPIDLARCPAGKCLRKMARSSCRPRHQQRA